MKISKLIEKLMAIKIVEGDLDVRYIDQDSELEHVEEVEVIKTKWTSEIYVELY